MDPADAALHVEARRVAVEPRDDARGRDERDLVHERNSPGPALQPRDRLEPPFAHAHEISLARVRDPQRPAVKTRRVRGRQAPGDGARPPTTGPRAAPEKTPPRPSTG